MIYAHFAPKIIVTNKDDAIIKTIEPKAVQLVDLSDEWLAYEPHLAPFSTRKEIRVWSLCKQSFETVWINPFDFSSLSELTNNLTISNFEIQIIGWIRDFELYRIKLVELLKFNKKAHRFLEDSMDRLALKISAVLNFTKLGSIYRFSCINSFWTLHTCLITPTKNVFFTVGLAIAKGGLRTFEKAIWLNECHEIAIGSCFARAISTSVAIETDCFSKLSGRRGIIQTFDFGVRHTSSPKTVEYFVFQPLYEGTLYTLFKTQSLCLDEKIQIAHLLIEGISNLETAGIVHGDLIRPNILYKRKNGIECVITDFNRAVCLANLNRSINPPRYVAPPEYLNGSKNFKKVDVWMLGLILYEMFNDEEPFWFQYLKLSNDETVCDTEIFKLQVDWVNQHLKNNDTPEKFKILIRNMLHPSFESRWTARRSFEYINFSELDSSDNKSNA